MPARILSYKSALLTLLTEPSYSHCRLLAHPLTAIHAPAFASCRDSGIQVLVQEVEHIEACVAAQARIDVADLALNVTVTKVADAILLLTDNSMSHTLFTTYYKGKTPSGLRKIKGIDKARTVELWVESLQQSPYPSLSALAPEAQASAVESLAAFTARDLAQQRMRDFRGFGARRQWVNQLNALRKETYGHLAKLPHLHTGLPTDFADQFFKKGSERAEGGEEEEEEAGEGTGGEGTGEQLEARLAALRAEVAAVEARLAAHAEAASAAKRAAERRAAREAQLAELRRAALEIERQRAALEAEIAAEAA